MIFRLIKSRLTESLSREHTDRARGILEDNRNCFCVFYGYSYKGKDVEIYPEVFNTSSEYENRVEGIIRGFDKHYKSGTVRAKASDFYFYAMYNRRRGVQKNENSKIYSNSKAKLNEEKTFKYYVASYISTNFSGMMDDLETDDRSEVDSFIEKWNSNGYDCVLVDNISGEKSIAYAKGKKKSKF